ncbi:hypothetical protein NQ315_013974 [Exocentrus adspersus]|uniref:Uncharacterized protein n=1 Tax=Exocentrus adspersus TaxID=1586481 RepID=A0AAV8VR36_9CUCU|nr:hypothetical protein NQ315_013974 [Exocentrus adspersus]
MDELSGSFPNPNTYHRSGVVTPGPHAIYYNSYLHYKCSMSIITVTSGEYCNNEVVDRVVLTPRVHQLEFCKPEGNKLCVKLIF